MIEMGCTFSESQTAARNPDGWSPPWLRPATNTMPHDIDFPSGCTAGYASPNNDAAADAEVNTLAHETEETTADEPGTAWYDRRGYENADKCAWTFGTTYTSGGGTANVTIGAKNFLVQQNWVNTGSGGCALHL